MYLKDRKKKKEKKEGIEKRYKPTDIISRYDLVSR